MKLLNRISEKVIITSSFEVISSLIFKTKYTDDLHSHFGNKLIQKILGGIINFYDFYPPKNTLELNFN
jgi:hypothetical protein